MLTKKQQVKKSLAGQAKHRKEGKTADWLVSYSRGFGDRFNAQHGSDKK